MSFGGTFITAAAGIVLHVTNYNATAHLEHHTRVFTKILGKHAVYFYAVFLVASALVRDEFIKYSLMDDQGENFGDGLYLYAGGALMAFGILLNIWTLQALGIKGMYNGDSFGWLMDAPVTGGPYTFFNDPQYVGTTAAMLGSAVYYNSVNGYVLTVLMGLTFWVSVRFVEGPHMNRIYAAKNK